MKDTVATKYKGKNEIFADVFNYFIYGGEQEARILSLVPDYSINLIAPFYMKDSDFEKF